MSLLDENFHTCYSTPRTKEEYQEISQNCSFAKKMFYMTQSTDASWNFYFLFGF